MHYILKSKLYIKFYIYSYNYMNIITGEKIQNETDIFITTPEILNCNKYITERHPKSFNIYNLNSGIDNPKYIYILCFRYF